MGKSCSKCFKANAKTLEDYRPNDSVNIIKRQSDKHIPSKNEDIKLNNIKAVKEISVNSNEKNPEEEKESKNNNWDNYFNKEQLKFYQRLYETESFDKKDLKMIKRFKKGELIGEGSFGKVYQGFDEEQGRLIAIKELDLEKINTKNLDDIQSVEIEIEILSRLQHKNIVKYYGVVRSTKNLHIILEFCIGGSVSKLLDTYKYFQETIIRKYTIQILEGLEYLHSHSIIHRDIKGANILVDRDGSCKLSDFGGAKMVKEEIDLKRHSFKGTPNWMAPETVKRLEYTRFSDIWSLGCTLIEMATGNPPWVEYRNPMTVLYNIYNATEPPKIPEYLSKELKDFISKCLKIEPRERYNVYELLRHPFITGDTTGFYSTSNNKIEYDNKFYSEEKSSRLYDTVKFNTSSDKTLVKTDKDLISTSNIIIVSKSPLSPITQRRIDSKFIEPLQDSPEYSYKK